jgi:hypothetical protein
VLEISSIALAAGALPDVLIATWAERLTGKRKSINSFFMRNNSGLIKVNWQSLIECQFWSLTINNQQLTI